MSSTLPVVAAVAPGSVVCSQCQCPVALDAARPDVPTVRNRKTWQYVLPLNSLTPALDGLQQLRFRRWLEAWIIRYAETEMTAVASRLLVSSRRQEVKQQDTDDDIDDEQIEQIGEMDVSTDSGGNDTDIECKRSTDEQGRSTSSSSSSTIECDATETVEQEDAKFSIKRYHASMPMTPALQSALEDHITRPVQVFFDNVYETPDMVQARLQEDSDDTLPPGTKRRRRKRTVKRKKGQRGRKGWKSLHPTLMVRYVAELSYCEPSKGTLTHLRFIDIQGPVPEARKQELMGPPEQPVVYHSLAQALCLASNYSGISNPRPTYRANARTKWRRLLPGDLWQPLTDFMHLLQLPMTRTEAHDLLRKASKPPQPQVVLPRPKPIDTTAIKRKRGRPPKVIASEPEQSQQRVRVKRRRKNDNASAASPVLVARSDDTLTDTDTVTVHTSV